MPRTNTGLTLIPVTKTACARWQTEESPSQDACLAPTGTAHVVQDAEVDLVEAPAKEPMPALKAKDSDTSGMPLVSE